MMAEFEKDPLLQFGSMVFELLQCSSECTSDFCIM